MAPLFVLAGDAQYHFLIAANCQSVRTVYPAARLVVFDLGLTPRQAESLRATGVDVIDWRARLTDVAHVRDGLTPEQLRKITFAFNARRTGWRKRVRKFMLKRFPASRTARAIEAAAVRFEALLIEKIRCMRHASGLCGDSPMVFLDADAILFEPIDEIFESPADVTVTLIESVRSFEFNRCFVLNSGVVMFGRDADARNAFLDAWWAEALANREWLREQTALVRLIERSAPAAFRPWAEAALALGGRKVGLRVVPCAVYNFFEMENTDFATFPPAKIFHFAGRQQEPATFKALLARLRAAARNRAPVSRTDPGKAPPG